MSNWVLGIVGGSGLYDLPGLEDAVWRTISSPWGTPSDQILFGRLSGVEVRFLPRHGRGHRLSPSHLNYRANIDALKRSGCTDILSVSACGSLREEIVPGDVVVVDQFIDRTFARASSFFGEGVVAHVSMAQPICPRLATIAADEAEANGLRVHRGGVYLVMEGPQFSTRAESNLYRSWGCDVIGMTNMPEAKLAREAELPYATLAMATDYDCWRDLGEAVTVSQVVEVLRANAAHAGALVASIAGRLSSVARTPDPTGIDTTLDNAILTPIHMRDPVLVAKLDAITRRVLEA
jgi:5'-methylthioadenosine phosphorylase